MLRYWLKVLNSKNVLIASIYEMLVNDVMAGLTYKKLNWTYHINNSLEKNGFGYIWNNQNADAMDFEIIKLRITKLPW